MITEVPTMDQDGIRRPAGRHMWELDRAEALGLLATVPLGRIVGRPMTGALRIRPDLVTGFRLEAAPPPALAVGG
ncbi:hypothetical protein [Streptomyces lavendulae]|uniref:hypothetical protein n=1 Tax=Streptomyces lavendulae TaxID=1914 RepID=UPI003405E2F7